MPRQNVRPHQLGTTLGANRELVQIWARSLHTNRQLRHLLFKIAFRHRLVWLAIVDLLLSSHLVNGSLAKHVDFIFNCQEPQNELVNAV